MKNIIVVHGTWKVSDGDYISKERTYKELHLLRIREERRTVKGLLASVFAITLPFVLLILNIASKIKF